jgi:large subunit ribosomal protein L25
MKKDITIQAESRSLRGKNEARRLRVKGWAPGVLYGAEKESVAVAVNPKEVNKILHSATGHNTIFTLAIKDGETTPVMVVDWQNDPIKSNLLHVDLKRIDLTKRISVQVPVHIHGDAKGVKLQGGLLEVVTREVEVDCLPTEIPDQFNVDVTEMVIGGAIRASELPMTGSMKLVSSGELVIAHIVSLKAEAAAAEVPGTAEPEVVKKGKKEEAAAPATKTAAKTATKAAAKTAAPAKKTAPAATKKK